MMNVQNSWIQLASPLDEPHSHVLNVAGMMTQEDSPNSVLNVAGGTTNKQMQEGVNDGFELGGGTSIESTDTRNMNRKRRRQDSPLPPSGAPVTENHQVVHFNHTDWRQDETEKEQRQEAPFHSNQMHQSNVPQEEHTETLQLLDQERKENQNLQTQIRSLTQQNVQSLQKVHALDAELRNEQAEKASLQMEHRHVLNQLATSLRERESLKQELLQQLAEALKENARLKHRLVASTNEKEPSSLSSLEQKLMESLREKQILQEQLDARNRAIQEIEAKLVQNHGANQVGKDDIVERLKNQRLVAEIEQLKQTVAQMKANNKHHPEEATSGAEPNKTLSHDPVMDFGFAHSGYEGTTDALEPTNITW